MPNLRGNEKGDPMSPETVVYFQAAISNVAVKYRRYLAGCDLVDFEQELWVWLLEFIKATPDKAMTDIQINLEVEAKRRVFHNHPTPERVKASRSEVQKTKWAWKEYISTLAYPERTIMTLTKIGTLPKDIADRLNLSRTEVTATKYALIQNFKVFLRRYLERA